MRKSEKEIKVQKFFLKIKKINYFLSILIDYFDTNNIEFGFLGGSVRAAINGDNSIPRDIDIVFDGNDSSLDYFLKNNSIRYKKNSFGGRKIITDNIEYDIWSLSQHYSIKEMLYKQDFKNIPKTTFVNYDSIFFNWTKQQLFDKYSLCVEKKVIDFVGKKICYESNPQLDVAICKLALLKNSGYIFSKKVDAFISRYINTCFKMNGLFDKDELFDCFICNYRRHKKKPIDSNTKDIIYQFIMSYL